MKYPQYFTILLSIMLASCATTKDSVLLGVGSGAATGAASGALIGSENRGKGALIGAATGALIGGVASYFIHKGLEKRDDNVRRETLFNLDKYGVSGAATQSGNSPAISFPVVEEHNIDAQVKGKKLIGPHKVWVISEDAQWLLDGDEKQKSKK